MPLERQAVQKCTRCGAEGHLAAQCPNKPYFQVFCAYCKKPGHDQRTCRIAWCDDRSAREAERKAASADREQQEMALAALEKSVEAVIAQQARQERQQARQRQ